ncbi:MAG TPA: cytochrome c [Acetobacteraceae bacterium]|nr:cytochrome c [Acetobacteraceae bacterium]
MSARPAVLMIAPLVMTALALAGCKRADMASQPKVRTWDRSSFFDNQTSMLHPEAGTVARNPADAPVPQPARITAAMLARGRSQYQIFCATCHAASGDGGGIIPSRGYPQPVSFHIARLRRAKAKYLFDVITHGHGVMYGYAARLAPADRWAVVAYLRALQISQDAPVASLSPQDRTRLQALASR